jgi:catechol 2,3-dioxygenase-like lactoylglutathione lyase family enzyme
MLDHISYSVKNFKQSAAFYDATLGELGYKRLMEFNDPGNEAIGYGKDKAVFWIGVDGSGKVPGEIGNAKGLHIAFVAESAQAIDKWYAKALELGAKDNGKPGVRTEYHPNYYAAFVVDPNGWKIEAVMHTFKGGK